MKITPTGAEIGATTVKALSKAASAHPLLAVGVLAVGALVSIASLAKDVPKIIEATKKD